MHITQASSNPTIWRGPRPLCIADLVELKVAGFATIINLQNDTTEFSQVDDERLWCTQLDLEFSHIPCSFVNPPSKTKLLTVVDYFMKSTGPVYVHCHDGVDRTGAAVAAFNIWVQGWTFAAAFQNMLKNGFHLGRYYWWLPYLYLRMR